MKLSIFEQELFDQFIQESPKGILANFLAALLILFLFWNRWQPGFWVWMGLFSGAMLYRLAIFWLYKQNVINRVVAFNLTYVGIVATAIVWVLALWLVFQNVGIEYKVFIGFIIGGLSAGAVAIFSMVYRFSVTFVTITLLLAAIWFLSADTRIENIMGLGTLILYAYLLQVAKVFSRNYRNLLALSHQKETILKKLEQSNNELKLIFENTPMGIFFYDSHLNVIDANENLMKLLGVQKDALARFNLARIEDKNVRDAIQKAVEKGEPQHYEGAYTTALSGKQIYIRLITNPVKDRSGTILGGLGMMEDIEEEIKTKQRLHNYAQFYLANPNPLFQIDCKSKKILIENEAMQNLRRRILHWQELVESICTGDEERVETRVGERFYAFDIVRVNENCSNVYVRDVTLEKRAKEEAEFFAYYDELTKLPRKKVFTEFMKKAQKHAKRYDRLNALLFIDLDDFKKINDTYGHSVGDEFLVQIANRLRKILRGVDVITRLGGDEFAVLLTDLPGNEEEAKERVEHVVQKILHTINDPLVIGDITIKAAASVGIALFRDESIDEVFKNADLAMYEAKNEGKNRYKFYTEEIRIRYLEKNRLFSELERAILANDFVLYLQPVVRLEDGACVGAEALMRWRYRQNTLLYPDIFIKFAEEGQHIYKLTMWAIKEASRHAENLDQIERISVNLSMQDLQNERFIDDIRRLIETEGVDPKRLMLEITETIALEDYVQIASRVERLKDFGFRIAIDDFGTGYSSMYYLKHLDVDTIKIDKTFIDAIEKNRKDRILTGTVIDLAKLLGLKTIAEGVERKEQLDILKSQGCDKAQGYLFAKPMPPKDFVEYLAAAPVAHD